ncbi:MAG: rhodanese-like domain-containing protein [Planctomycetota bacterium]
MTATARRARRGSVLVRSLVIIAGTVSVALAHSWVRQAGEEPLTLGADESALQQTVLPPSEDVELGGAGMATAATDAGDVLGFEITVDQASRLYDTGMAVFFDARLQHEYEDGHIDGASFVPAEAFATGLPMAVEFAMPDQPVVIYCGGGECEASHNVAAVLQSLGYTRLHIMTEGYPAWVDMGLPTSSGPDPLLEGGM